MEETNKKNTELEEQLQEEEESSLINLQKIIAALILNWKWFVLSVIICLGAAAIYLRYTTPQYSAGAKILIKDDDSNTRRSSSSSIRNSNTLGTITNTNGIDNEMEILDSHILSASAVRNLKLYVNYKTKGRVKDAIVYQTQPVTVDIDEPHLDKLGKASFNLTIERDGKNYNVNGTYTVPGKEENIVEGPFSLNRTLTSLPATIATRAGILTLTANELSSGLKDGDVEYVNLVSPKTASYKYVGELTIAQTQKNTTIANLTMTDEVPQRAIDYLRELTVVYNQQANEDKNEIALRTEKFINGRLEKINAELGSTEGALESYKQRNKLVDVKSNATSSMANQTEYEQRLADANTQIELLNSLNQYMNQPGNRYQVLPSNVGLNDASSTSLINKYNEIALQRNRLLQSASETSPTVVPLTRQLDELTTSIHNAMGQARRNLNITRNSIASQLGKYQSQVSETPQQERMLTQIGRQQEVKSGLYLMLLQKREENSISLAATADKGKLIDDPQFYGQVSPRKSIIYLIALLIGLALPSLVLFLVNLFRYKIEGHADVERLTRLPIIADVAVASDQAKTKADIVVHENKNNQMAEIFRGMRTNLQFMLKDNQKVIMFTSSTSGEGKTFNAANLSVSFALLGKKVILVGLDIRKPRLAELLEIANHHTGITNLLIKENLTKEEVNSQILPSGVNKNLDVLLAGPIPPNPSELLSRPSLEEVMAILREEYDYIIVDTAPVGLVTDTVQLGRIADATVIMCRADYTQKAAFGLINQLNDDKKLPNMSIVINGIDLSKKKYGYYYGYGRYGKYSKYGYYGHYGKYGKYGHYGTYGNYGGYGSYGDYKNSRYGNPDDDSVKLKKH